MPWTVADPMLERARLVALHAERLHTFAELAAARLALVQGTQNGLAVLGVSAPDRM